MLPLSAKKKIKKRLAYYLKADQNFAKIFKAIKRDFDASGLVAHNWEHIYRDILKAIYIGEAEKANMKIVLPAITMHDIGFLYGANGKTHCAVGVQKLSGYLKKIKVSFSPTDETSIKNCIATHKGRFFGLKPHTLEAKVVADADILEAMGTLGVYKVIRTYTEFNKPIETIIARGLKISRTFMETAAGNKLAEQGRKISKQFFVALKKANEPYT